MSLGSFIKNLCDIMRGDDGVNGDAQRIEQIAWLLFLKVYDVQEAEWEIVDDYTSIIPEELRWRNWAVDHKDGKVLTGGDLLKFINNELFPKLRNMEINAATERNKSIARDAFTDCHNYMVDGVILRQVINIIDSLELEDYRDRCAFSEIYETFLRALQSAGRAGEFYTPRAVTDFIVEMVKPKLGETVADFACGTGGFLTATLKRLDEQAQSPEDRRVLNSSIYGIDKKSLPYLLCATNMLLHGVDNPKVFHGNALNNNVREYTDEDRFDVILMNPPYGGTELNSVQGNFPAELRSSETADLFVSLIMYRLKRGGRAAVILPDGFLFGTDNAKAAIKKKLFGEFNLHTVIRLPESVFSPYTSITTNILFFDATGPTRETWFYRLDKPEGIKHFSKTKPMKREHCDPAAEWWNDRHEITVNGFDKAKKFSLEEIAERNYNIDLCGYPHKEEDILSPRDLIADYQERRGSMNADMDRILSKITNLLSDVQS